MKYSELVDLVKDQPVFESGILLSGEVDPDYLRKQISLWVKSRKIIQLRRGLYALAPPFKKVKPHPFLVSNRLQSASYVSYQSALAYYGMIPEYVPLTTGATTKKPGERQTFFGVFKYHHVKKEWFHHYEYIHISENQFAYIATPEKALLDLIILVPRSDSIAYLRGLRIQNLKLIDLNKLEMIIQSAKKPKLFRFFAQYKIYLQNEDKEEISL